MIGKISRVPLRKVWKHEALDFTHWLEQNIDVLSDVVDISLSSVEREQAAGSFSVDLVAEDDAGNSVIIENQLERSNHDHLGKVLTYLVAVDAKTAIWIVSDPRPEHVSAIAWLNESSAASFYLLKIEAITIGESVPAPLLTLIVGPSDEVKEAAKTKQELAGRYLIRHRFWTSLLEKANAKVSLHNNISPGRYSWIAASAGKQGLSFNYVIRRDNGSVELYIDKGKDSQAQNLEMFQALQKRREDVEKSFGGDLEWDQSETRRSCRIRWTTATGGYRDEENWGAIQEEMVDAMVRLSKALKPHLTKIPY